MKYCKKCDKEFKDQDDFCDMCGRKLVIKFKNKKKVLFNFRKIIMFVGILLVIGAFVFFIFYLNQDKENKPPIINSTRSEAVSSVSNVIQSGDIYSIEQCKNALSDIHILSSDLCIEKDNSINIQINRGTNEGYNLKGFKLIEFNETEESISASYEPIPSPNSLITLPFSLNLKNSKVNIYPILDYHINEDWASCELLQSISTRKC